MKNKALNKKKIILISAISATVVVGVIFCVFIIMRPTPVSGILDGGVEKEKGSVCILIAGRDDAAGLCDSLMLASFNRDEKKACILQIPRDTYAAYTSDSYKKINAAPIYLGGMEEFCSFLGEAMGVVIDGYVSFELDVLSEVVDRIGGIDVNVPVDMYYNDPYQNLYISLQKGERHLDGEAAEMLVRYRQGYVRGDIDRLDTQKLFMKALFNKVRESNTIELLFELLPTFDGFRTNISIGTMAELANEALCVEDEDILFFTLPGREAVASISGAAYYVVSKESAQALLKEYFNCGTFDEKKIFLNVNYKEFEEIYYEAR